MAIKIIGFGLALLTLGGVAGAQSRFTDGEIVSLIATCLQENAPKNWQSVIFTLDEAPAGKNAPPIVSHKVVVGSENSPPKDVKPCRPDYATKAVNTFRENQDEKAASWTGVTITFNRDRRYKLEFRYPK